MKVQTRPEFIEDQRRKALGEDISMLRCSRYVENADITSSHMILNEVKLDLGFFW